MKKIVLKIFLLTLLCIVIPCTLVFADDNTTASTIEEQKEEFGIQDFINNSKQYLTGEFFNNVEIVYDYNNFVVKSVSYKGIIYHK